VRQAEGGRPRPASAAFLYTTILNHDNLEDVVIIG
jgi:hypothetical protein